MKNLEERGHLLTEQVNTNSENLDQLSSIELVDLFNREDAQTLSAIARAREQLAQAIDIAAESLRQGGRLFYVGAGTSGRLGVLDAASVPHLLHAARTRTGHNCRGCGGFGAEFGGFGGSG